LIGLICGEVVKSRNLVGLDWQAVTIVFDIGAGSVSNSGFAYLADDIIPVVSTGGTVGDYVRALRDEIKLADQRPFIQMLVQIRRSDGKIRADFEYEDSSRWGIDPTNLPQMRERLRPTFSD